MEALEIGAEVAGGAITTLPSQLLHRVAVVGGATAGHRHGPGAVGEPTASDCSEIAAKVQPGGATQAASNKVI